MRSIVELLKSNGICYEMEDNTIYLCTEKNPRNSLIDLVSIINRINILFHYDDYMKVRFNNNTIEIDMSKNELLNEILVNALKNNY